MTLLILASILSLVYSIYWIVSSDKLPESLSSTYYILKDKGWIFQLYMIVIGFSLLPVWLSVSESNLQFLVFTACSSVLFISASPSFKLKLDGKIHYTAAIMCCISALLWQILEGLYDITLLTSFICFLFWIRYKSWFFWIELAVLYSVIFNIWRLL